jgi:hypothetical protein
MGKMSGLRCGHLNGDRQVWQLSHHGNLINHSQLEKENHGEF